MERKYKRQQRTVGSIVEIPLEDGFHSYGHILETQIAFYNIHTKDKIELGEIITFPVLFITTVYDYAITKGYWLKVGKKVSLDNALVHTLPRYNQDMLNPQNYTLVYDDKQVSATKEECIGLEYWSVWQPEKIEERLNDYFAGRKNKYVERMLCAEMYPPVKSKQKSIVTEKVHNKIAV